MEGKCKMDTDKEINDFERNKVYSIFVNNEDYDRALSDHQFAHSLMIHARMTAEGQSSEFNINQPSTSGLQNKETNSESLPSFGEFESEVEDYVQENIPSNTQNSNVTNVWSYDKTTCLIHSMATYYSDFNDPRKRKHIFEHVANDLISAGFTVDSRLVQNKWKGLLRSYTKAKDTKNRTDQGPSRFLFYEIIDDIVGNHPKNSCHHSLNSLDTTTAVTDTEEINVENTGGTDENQEVDSLEGTEKNNREEHTNSNNKRKRSSKQQMKKEYIDLEREEYARRQKRHEDKCSMEKERNEIERRKLNVLEKYLENKLMKPS